ncbi:MAG: OmpH family outer membrane protein [Pseudomonadota bacterium]
MRMKLFAMAGAVMVATAGFAGHAVTSKAEAQSNAQAPVILTISMDRVIAQSKAGKTIPTQAESVRNDVAKELEAEADKLKKDIENFQKNSQLMSEEVRAKTGQELQARAQVGLPQRAQIVEQAFRYAVQNAQGEILKESQPILEDIVKKRGATVLLDSTQVMYAAVETDITQEVIAALDKEIDKVEVQKISLAEIEKQIREAQAKAQADAARNQ